VISMPIIEDVCILAACFLVAREHLKIKDGRSAQRKRQTSYQRASSPEAMVDII